jgi:hypothetical protein
MKKSPCARLMMSSRPKMMARPSAMRAMIEQAENDGEAERDEGDDQTPDQAVHRQQQKLVHRAQ